MTTVTAYASQFNINPVLVTLSESRRVGALALKNESDKMVTVQAKLFAWQQDENGKDQLTPSDTLSYMPRIVQLKPGEERSIRIAFSSKSPPAAEQAYRIYLTEQPQATTDPDQKRQLTVALKMGVPVFVSPKETARDKGAVGEVTAVKGAAGFVVQNTGNARLVMKSVIMTGQGASGSDVFTVEMGRQFVLAGMKKRFSAKLPADTCGKAASLRIVGELETGGTLTATLPLSPMACGE